MGLCGGGGGAWGYSGLAECTNTPRGAVRLLSGYGDVSACYCETGGARTLDSHSYTESFGEYLHIILYEY